jgi:D-amino peptidase
MADGGCTVDHRQYMVRCDIEGVSGIVSYTQAEPGAEEYEFGKRMFQSDLLALLEGLLAGGANSIVIYDEHYYGRNIDPAWLSPGVTAICGKPPYRIDWPGGLDATFDGVVLLGFHAKAGTVGALLPHSYEPDIRDLRLNGVSIGEIGMEAAVAGDCGVPVVLVTGDSASAAEAESLLPGVRAVAVKEAFAESGARCYPLVETSARIRAAAEAIVKNPPVVRPYRCQAPVTLEVELQDGAYRDALQSLYPGEMVDENTLSITGGKATIVWADYWQRKLRCQAAMRQGTTQRL